MKLGRQQINRLLLVFISLVFSSCQKLEIEREIRTEVEGIFEITSNSAIVRSKLIDIANENSVYGHCWDTVESPNIEGLHSDFIETNYELTYNTTLTKLLADKQYYVRPYTVNSLGINYGEEITFKTHKDTLPTIATNLSEVVDTTQIVLVGQISDLGYGFDTILQYGHCWSKLTTPTISDNNNKLGATNDTISFSSEISNLKSATYYYFRAYAITTKGVLYGNTDTILTHARRPEIIIKANYPELDLFMDMTISGNDALFLNDYGVIWGKSSSHLTHDTSISFGTSIISSRQVYKQFEIANIHASEEYFFRGYCVLYSDTVYSRILRLTTKDAEPPTFNIFGGSYNGHGLTLIYDNIDDKKSSTLSCGAYISTDKPIPDENDLVIEHSTPSKVQYELLFNDLTPSESYYIRPFVRNLSGVEFSNVIHITIPRIDIVMRYINLDTISIGSNAYHIAEQPKHEVRIDGFLISEKEISLKDYCYFLNSIAANNDGTYMSKKYIEVDSCLGLHYSNGSFTWSAIYEDIPVSWVTWEGASAFCNWLGGSLPTEVEWEFASRGHNRDNLFSGNSNINSVAWFDQNSNNTIHKSGTKTPNSYLLSDMSGNLREWCHDWYDESYYSICPFINPSGPNSGTHKVLRGGSYKLPEDYCRTTRRDYALPGILAEDVGFRVIMR